MAQQSEQAEAPMNKIVHYIGLNVHKDSIAVSIAALRYETPKNSPSYKSSGRSPVCRAILASIRGPISSPS